MVCRMWKGRTLQADAAAYENYLRSELFPRLQNDPGKRGDRGFADDFRKSPFIPPAPADLARSLRIE